jgi:hypothetical protein
VSVPEVKAMVRATTVSDAEALVHRIDRMATPAEVRAMVSEYVFSLTAPHRKAKV